MSTRTKSELYEWRERRIKLAITYLRRSAELLYMVDENRESLDLPVSPLYWDLLERALDAAVDVVGALPDDFFESRQSEDFFGLRSVLGDLGKHNLSDTALESAEKLVAKIKERRDRTVVLRKIKAMENTDGRTPAEAESFRAKAAELRETHGIPA